MAATFHVFVDGAVDATPDGQQQLATAMASRYGLPATDLIARFAKGRFRVKANVDQATADTYLRDLRAIGARCTIEPADATTTGAVPRAPVARATMPPDGSPAPSPARVTTRATAGSILPPATRASTPPPIGGFQSGLSAAFSGEIPIAGLGALEGNLSSFSLGSVDGGAEEPAPAAFEPPASAPVPTSKPAAPATPAKSAKPKDEPLDLFAPPDAQAEADFKVDLAPEEQQRHQRKRMSVPPPAAPVESAQTQPLANRRTGAIAPLADVAPPPPRAQEPPTNRNRFAAGVALSILLGFIPAHFVAAARERSAFKSVDDKIELAQEQATTPDAYAGLDRLRDEQLARKQSDRRSIAMMALAIWGLVAGGIAYVWFRRMPWDR